MLLEDTGEVLGIVEADGFGGLGNGVAYHQQRLGPVHQEAADICRCALSGTGADKVTEIVG